MASWNYTMERLLNLALNGATVKCLLLDTSTSYTHNPDSTAQKFVSDIPTAAEPGDASYSRQTLTGVSISSDDTDDEGVYDFDDVTFSSLTTTNDIQAVVFYAQDGMGSAGTDDTTPADDTLVLGFDDDSGDSGGIADLSKATNGSDFTISIDAEGSLNLSTPT